MRTFKVGDKVKMSEDKVIEVNKKLPRWYSKDIFTIEEILMLRDDNGHQIVKLKEKISTNVFNTLSADYLTLNIIEERKLKLKKINENV